VVGVWHVLLTPPASKETPQTPQIAVGSHVFPPQARPIPPKKKNIYRIYTQIFDMIDKGVLP